MLIARGKSSTPGARVNGIDYYMDDDVDDDDDMNDYNDGIKIKNEEKNRSSGEELVFMIKGVGINGDYHNNENGVDEEEVLVKQHTSVSSLSNSSLSFLSSHNTTNNNNNNHPPNAITTVSKDTTTTKTSSISNFSSSANNMKSNNSSINSLSVKNDFHFDDVDLLLKSSTATTNNLSSDDNIQSSSLSDDTSSQLIADLKQSAAFLLKTAKNVQQQVITPTTTTTPTATTTSPVKMTLMTSVKEQSSPTSPVVSQQQQQQQKQQTPIESEFLGLLDITHLLEYQPQSQLASTSSLSPLGSTSASNLLNSTVTSNSSILRGGHIDALIVLATSANSSVIAVSASDSNPKKHAYSSHTLNSNTFGGGGATSTALHNKYSNSTNNKIRTSGGSELGDGTTTTTTLNNHNNNINTSTNRKKNNFLFQEAFLTTYRTILEPIDLIKKLIHRYRLFSKNKPTSLRKLDELPSLFSPPTHLLLLPSSHPQNSCSIVNNKSNSIVECNDKFDLNRLSLEHKRHKMAHSATRNSLTLLIRVLDGLEGDLEKDVVEILSSFVFELIVDEELAMARLLRKKLLNKLERKTIEENSKNLKIFEDLLDSSKIKQAQKILPYLNTFTKRSHSLLDFKSIDIAEQMTLIDSSLFRKIELVEVLLWSTKQSEAHSPNLIRFTEHFNNISYWARSRILEHESYKDREKYLIKFLHIMKHLRKINNFNSYLAILSAVDSGPIQRLDWPKNISESIKEFSILIDPKCGFKSLREAVSEAQPPCIPHIGLILQDLTILHIANPDFLPTGNCNFWKRWQQYNILERLRCFKRCNYDFKSNSKIQEFFNNFLDYINEDAQYNLSEQLKPRSKNYNN